MTTMPTIDLNDPIQNGFVQDWLSAFNERHNEGRDDAGADHDYQVVEAAIEQVQETYGSPR